ncbi:MAG TPA: alkaline phosphatase family protein [Candidatus Acidoferrum sp.]|nr:alkaline phosphatase family protein [Candidatus Acidoferrum sp.]
MNLARCICALGFLALYNPARLLAQAPVARPSVSHFPTAKSAAAPSRPKLVVLLVVDQMRGDYVDKFQHQWTGGLRRMLQEGAWFREAAYPYAATETCVGHATISTGALPTTHGMVANAWWDRDSQKIVTCTSDPNVTNTVYGGGSATAGGDSAWRMRIPAFAEELRSQTGGDTRVVTFSLKARAAITMAGHKADAATWFDGGLWETSSPYASQPFIESFVKSHPMQADAAKTWELSLPAKSYLYDDKATGAVAPPGWTLTFPHVLNANPTGGPDAGFYLRWATSPYADTYLTKLAESAIDQLGLGQKSSTDFLGISYSSPDYVGHAFGPHSREIQDVLVRLDKDLADLFAHLDARVGHGNYVVALSADHGVVPVPEDMQKTGVDAGVLYVTEIQGKIEKALEPFNYIKPAVARIASMDVYFSTGIYSRLKTDPAALQAVLSAVHSVPGVADVYRAEELQDRPATQSPSRSAEAASYFPGRSGDLLVVPKPYWLVFGGPTGQPRDYGTGHGTPYYYDQHVPVLFMGWGIEHGQYFGRITPADIAPTLAALCGVTLSSSDGRALAEALHKANSGKSTVANH